MSNARDFLISKEKKNEIWVLSIRTSLPGVCESGYDLKLNTTAYDCFEKARSAMRKSIKAYTYSKNAMFDGKGGLIHLQKYGKSLESFEEDGEDEEEFVLTCKT